MVIKSIISAICACLAIVSFSVSAALVSVDWKTSGDGLITRDTRTGLEWLDFTETAGLSLEYVSSQFGPRGLFTGWSYGSTVQLEWLLDSAGGAGPYDGWSATNNGVVGDLLALMGDPYGNLDLRLITDTHFDGRSYWQGYLSDLASYPQSATQDYIRSEYGVGFDYIGYSDAASMLYRTSPVPVPAAVWLFGSGLLGLIGVARRKKS